MKTKESIPEPSYENAERLARELLRTWTPETIREYALFTLIDDYLARLDSAFEDDWQRILGPEQSVGKLQATRRPVFAE